MNKYTIIIEEVRQAKVCVEGETKQEALERFEKHYFENALAYDSILEPYDTHFVIREGLH